MAPIQMLWIGARLSTLERLAMTSFIANGHEVHLYTYGDVEGIPQSVAHRYAGDVLPPSAVFSDPAGFGKGSFGGFSDYFRYKLLYDRGGMWCDTDVVCLRPFDFIDEDYVIARERMHPDEATPESPERLNACVLKAPAESAVLAECVQICAAIDKNSFDWADIGANLVTRVFADHGLFGTALPARAICPFDSWEAPQLTSAPLPDEPACYAVHFWSEMWRHYGAQKDASYAEGSAYEALKRRYGVT